MSQVWDEARIKQYIADGVEESLSLDYKAAGSLLKTDGKKSEITKDVSAMANSAGGIIIYGISEYQDKVREHLPEKIDPIDRTQISKEWLEQVISNIRPKIDGLVIHPISISTALNHVAYVVEIPQSYTAHQATDKRYYKRFNFESVAMEDYEIKDIMGRRQHARIELKFKILVATVTERSSTDLFPSYVRKKQEPKKHTVYEMFLEMVNIGKVYAQYVEAYISMPCALILDYRAKALASIGRSRPAINYEKICTYTRDNTVRERIKGGYTQFDPAEYGPARYVPILPGTRMDVSSFDLTEEFESVDWGEMQVKWVTHVDSAPPYSGEIRIKDIEFIDKRRTSDDDGDEDFK